MSPHDENMRLIMWGSKPKLTFSVVRRLVAVADETRSIASHRIVTKTAARNQKQTR